MKGKWLLFNQLCIITMWEVYPNDQCLTSLHVACNQTSLIISWQKSADCHKVNFLAYSRVWTMKLSQLDRTPYRAKSKQNVCHVVTKASWGKWTSEHRVKIIVRVFLFFFLLSLTNVLPILALVYPHIKQMFLWHLIEKNNNRRICKMWKKLMLLSREVFVIPNFYWSFLFKCTLVDRTNTGLCKHFLSTSSIILMMG